MFFRGFQASLRCWQTGRDEDTMLLYTNNVHEYSLKWEQQHVRLDNKPIDPPSLSPMSSLFAVSAALINMYLCIIFFLLGLLLSRKSRRRLPFNSILSDLAHQRLWYLGVLARLSRYCGR
ncbi:hypothetical protein AcV7_004725 [Taiwanofungus camphoratus]|nr:hypothetical protein AcV7_004725 [Antrodia cinnamomea]